MFQDFVTSYLAGVRACQEELSREKLEKAMQAVTQAYEQGRRIFILGNGGSASTSSHMACDLGKGTSVAGRPRARVISLTDNIALLSAWANDAGYEVVFAEQLANLLEPGDVVIGISASGNSPNVLRAIEYAREHGAVTIAFIGFGGGRLKALVDIELTVSSKNYGQVEDLHLSLNHILSQYLKEWIQAKKPSGH
jgi:D-sedoheptulose 7-phosphate isomerase